ncbi:inositol-pentakisphosphate 2-kinase [Colias croceus]|uniref:inositol-pentakisphosphate 2-kinase n=1 Tax=Colias crocea TaxID=72248 RepID=UPI001E27E466|nr:inositol-pentakisphosphate 2-kinase [Colias croceus]
MSIINNEWKYINEGNVHMVLEIVNTPNVYRLIKDDSHTNTGFVRQSIEYVNFVMLPLIHGNAAYEHEIVTLSKDEIEKLILKLADVRPKNRQHKTLISPFAIKAPNLTKLNPSINNYCIEIKPKEGFLAKSFQKYSKCYYCLKQFLKLSTHEINNVSEYCPLDFYSGNESRMKFALLNLINNPQNNFKMFKNGNIIFNEHSNKKQFDDIIESTIFKYTDVFLNFLIQILLSDGNSIINLTDKDYTPLKLSANCVEGKDLPHNSLLHNLLSLQKLTEDLNIDYSSDNDYSYVTKILDRLKSEGLNFKLENDKRKFLDTAENLELALISAIAKDCSIMIAFTEQYCDGHPWVMFQGRKMSYRWAVTDLEPKSVKTLVKRVNTEKQLIEIYEDIMSN